MTVEEIALALIDPPANPSRLELDPSTLVQLAESMRTHGLIQFPCVRRTNERFRLVAGHRRTMAANSLGWSTITANIIDCDDQTEDELRAIENLERQDLTPVEEAIEVRRLQERYDYTHEKLAERLKRSTDWVKRRLMVLVLPDDIMRALHSGTLTLGVALELGKVQSDELRTFAFNNALTYGMTIENAKAIAASANQGTLIPSSESLEQARENYVTSPARHRITCHVCGRRHTLSELANVFMCHACITATENAALGLEQPDLPNAPA